MAPTPAHPPTRGFQTLLTPAQWQDLIGSGRPDEFRGRTPLLHQGDSRPVVYVVKRGRVRVTHSEPDGNQALIAIRGPGDLLGEYAHHDQGAHMASVWTLEDCDVSIIGSDAFGALIRRHRLDSALQRYLLGKIRQGGQRIWRASNLQAEQRMALLFLEVVGAAPADAEPTVPMTQAEIATSLGVALSSVTSVLALWKARGTVRTVPAPLRVLDLATLARHANTR